MGLLKDNKGVSFCVVFSFIGLVKQLCRYRVGELTQGQVDKQGEWQVALMGIVQWNMSRLIQCTI